MAFFERAIPHETLHHLADVLVRRFIQRHDVYAQQLDDGRYICVHEPLTYALIKAHLSGTITLGSYLLAEDNTARYLVLDADDEPSWERVRQMADGLRECGIPSYLEQSRRGGHLWFFFQRPIQAALARSFAHTLIERHQLPPIEVYPKQDTLKDGPGSLIRLPFGIHRASGQRYGFVDPEGHRLAPTIRAQIALFEHVATVPNVHLRSLERPDFGPPNPVAPMASVEEGAPVSERIKGAISVFDFVSRYVALSDGGVGSCPFHDDKHPSFSVNRERNYWSCFAGCGGGSVIDFWMKREECDFKTAVTQLAQMLL